jgi:VanZ family protein
MNLYEQRFRQVLDLPDDAKPPPARIEPVLSAGQYGWLTLGIAVLAVYGSIVPLEYRPQSFADALAVFRDIALAPPTDLGARGDWVISVVLFGVLGFGCMGMFCVDRRPAEAWRTGPFIILAGVALSAGIEFLQTYFPPRTVSLNDLILQVVGACLGVVVWIVAGQRITNWARRLSSATGVAGLAKRLWPGYLVILIATQLMPFDFTISAAELAVKAEEGKISLVPFAVTIQRGIGDLIGKLFIHTLCFAPLGFLWVLATGRAATHRTNWLAVALLGVGFAALVEVLQLFVYTRFFDTTDILLGGAAVTLGWWTGEAFSTRWHEALAKPELSVSPRWPLGVWLSLIAVWLGLVMYFNWSPFNFTSDPAAFTGDSQRLPEHGMRRFALMPIVDYYWGNKYNALDQFLKKALSFAPLGVLITLSFRRLYQPGSAWRVLGLALAAAVILEAGSYFLPGRIPSSTDVLIACTGAFVGFALTQHIRVIFWAERTLFGYMHQFAR